MAYTLQNILFVALQQLITIEIPTPPGCLYKTLLYYDVNAYIFKKLFK